ncbi:uncharacterized protein LOC109597527 isoform X2 [Aethina tumida]|uniref:uncharacterized protein LOC109597527 isoform X2 n=1 Tax=Aethina tumida TaxID=116153 RepID=UPI00096B4AB1|nr:uncharacterized protein LOC109597527 isoform X2 [Aethina tumida]
MLKFLTHKLRTHSINEDGEKTDENHDSGTESDEDVDTPELSSVREKTCSSASPADTGCSMESPAPDQHDPHSSEEELEVINGGDKKTSDTTSNVPSTSSGARPLRAASACLPEKRKWSQVGDTAHKHRQTPDENEENMSHYGNLSPASPCSPYLKCYGDDGTVQHSGSSDEEVHHLLASMATPVQFRTSPPLEAVKPGGRRQLQLLQKGRSQSPPAKLLHYELSPRKRSRHLRNAHVQRPYLDFEKMQQLKARSVTAWRHTGDHGGELSVFCW